MCRSMMSEKITMVEPFKRSSFNDAGIGIVLLPCQIAMICMYGETK